MVDIVGATPIEATATARTAPVTPVVRAPAPAATAAADTSQGGAAQTGSLAATLAASPPVDTDRVATIKKAIADGRFPILPATIADRLIALKLQWHPDDAHDQA